MTTKDKSKTAIHNWLVSSNISGIIDRNNPMVTFRNREQVTIVGMSISILDALYSLRAFLGCVIYPSYPFPTPFERIKGRNFLPPSSITLIGTFVRSTEVIV